jgi:hypothetical protein
MGQTGRPFQTWNTENIFYGSRFMLLQQTARGHRHLPIHAYYSLPSSYSVTETESTAKLSECSISEKIIFFHKTPQIIL